MSPDQKQEALLLATRVLSDVNRLSRDIAEVKRMMAPQFAALPPTAAEDALAGLQTGLLAYDARRLIALIAERGA